jgi:hypothetical protein
MRTRAHKRTRCSGVSRLRLAVDVAQHPWLRSTAALPATRLKGSGALSLSRARAGRAGSPVVLKLPTWVETGVTQPVETAARMEVPGAIAGPVVAASGMGRDEAMTVAGTGGESLYVDRRDSGPDGAACAGSGMRSSRGCGRGRRRARLRDVAASTRRSPAVAGQRAHGGWWRGGDHRCARPGRPGVAVSALSPSSRPRQSWAGARLEGKAEAAATRSRPTPRRVVAAMSKPRTGAPVSAKTDGPAGGNGTPGGPTASLGGALGAGLLVGGVGGVVGGVVVAGGAIDRKSVG